MVRSLMEGLPVRSAVPSKAMTGRMDTVSDVLMGLFVLGWSLVLR